MKIIIALFGALFFLSMVSAIPNPAPIYCENMGYTVDGGDCIFDDATSCEVWAFYNGECGKEYLKELDCAQAGDSLSPGIECCDNLKGINRARYHESGACEFMEGTFGICQPCGDGVCDDTIENFCNCPEDCEKDDDSTSSNLGGPCDATKPCPNGQTCVGFPGKGLECVSENVDPCTLIDCDGECAIAESYPSRVMCNDGSNICEGDECEGTVSYDVETGRVEYAHGRRLTVHGATSGNSAPGSRGVFAFEDGRPVPFEGEIEVLDEKMYMKNSQGIKGEVKIMPSEASEKAIEKLGDLGFDVELVDDGNTEKVHPMYRFEGEKEGRFLGVFKVQARIAAEVDAVDGSVEVRKPWWAFLASGI